MHWDIGEDAVPKTHAHVTLTMREIRTDGDEPGFGQKVRGWNLTEMVEHWRERWAELANERLAELDIDARIERCSLEAQGIALELQSHIGAPAERIVSGGIKAADRAEMHREIAEREVVIKVSKGELFRTLVAIGSGKSAATGVPCCEMADREGTKLYT